MKIQIQADDLELFRLTQFQGGWAGDVIFKLVIGDTETPFKVVCLVHNNTAGLFGDNFLTLEPVCLVKSKEQILAEEAVLKAEQSVEKAKEALQASQDVLNKIKEK